MYCNMLFFFFFHSNQVVMFMFSPMDSIKLKQKTEVAKKTWQPFGPPPCLKQSSLEQVALIHVQFVFE